MARASYQCSSIQFLWLSPSHVLYCVAFILSDRDLFRSESWSVVGGRKLTKIV